MTDRSIPLPRLYESVLDEATLDALFGDVGMLDGVSVTVKGAPAARCSDEPFTLASAHAALVAGQVRGVQLRYVHDGKVWCDTLIRMVNGFRLVRVALDEVYEATT